jgi:hypothetical protein
VLCRMGAWLGLPAAQGFMCGWCTVTRVPVTYRPGFCTVIPR